MALLGRIIRFQEEIIRYWVEIYSNFLFNEIMKKLFCAFISSFLSSSLLSVQLLLISFIFQPSNMNDFNTAYSSIFKYLCLLAGSAMIAVDMHPLLTKLAYYDEQIHILLLLFVVLLQHVRISGIYEHENEVTD